MAFLVPDVINAKEYVSATCDKMYQGKETVKMSHYGYPSCAIRFTLNKEEEEVEKCKFWSKKDIAETIKEVFPDD